MVTFIGCTTAKPVTNLPKGPETPLRKLYETGKYHDAMRELPKTMAAWKDYTKRTGRTAEGAAGYLCSQTLHAVATKGDAEWGKILDDTQIPYKYKIQMIFEILERRLGKGAVYVGNKDNLIVPRTKPIDLKDMIKLPE